MKMEKTPRYTQRERNMVLGYAAQYKDVIENKRTDAESNRKKDEVWRQIAKEFNARVYHQRSSKQLRQLYKNMKLLLKKDLCGEGKGNRSFMDLLNTLSQQESVAQYISEQMSPSGYSSSRQQKYDDDYDDSKLASVGFDGMDTDVIVIKSEDISDNDQSQNGGNPDDMDDDDDDSLSNKGIPEVCLEEEDDEIFATDLRQPHQSQSQQQQTPNQRQQQQQTPTTPPEITIQNVGGIRVGSIGSLANLKALQNSSNSALSITHANSNGGGTAGNTNANSSSNNNHSSTRNPLSAAELAQQQLLLNGLGLSAVHAPEPADTTTKLPALHRGSSHSHNNHNNHNNHNSHGGGSSSNNNSSSISNSINQLLLSLNGGAYGGHTKGPQMGNSHGHAHGHGHSSGSHGSSNNAGSNRNEYLMSLAIEERKLKLELLNAQIDYWKTLTKKLDANSGHNPTPACLCHFPGKVNGLQTQTSSS